MGFNSLNMKKETLNFLNNLKYIYFLVNHLIISQNAHLTYHVININ